MKRWGEIERGGQHRVGGLDAEELVDKREYKLKRRLRSQTLRHMVTFLITVRSPEVVIRSAIIPPSKYSRHESSIRDVEIACGIRGYLFVGYVTYVVSRLEVQALRDHWRDTKGNRSRTVNTCLRFGRTNRSRTIPVRRKRTFIVIHMLPRILLTLSP